MLASPSGSETAIIWLLFHINTAEVCKKLFGCMTWYFGINNSNMVCKYSGKSPWVLAAKCCLQVAAFFCHSKATSSYTKINQHGTLRRDTVSQSTCKSDMQIIRSVEVCLESHYTLRDPQLSQHNCIVVANASQLLRLR